MGAPLLPGLVALVFAISIGFDTINKAYLYQELKRRTAEIEVALVDAEPTSEMIRKARRDLLRIEQDEPPVKHALNTMCHNEVAYVSQVHNKYLQEVRWYKRLTAQFFSWPNDKKLSDLAAPSVE